jgi:glycosyltransferase involved in cell wall biosynthesis
MKTIIYTGAFRFPIGDAAAQRVLNNAKIFRDLGHKVIFVSFGGITSEDDKGKDGYYCFEGFRYIISNEIDIRSSNVFERLYNFFYSGRRALRIISRMNEKIDIIIGYSPSMFFTNKILELCHRKKIIFVSDISEWYDSNEFPGGRFFPPAWINDMNMNLTQKKVKNKILISSYLDKFYKSSNNIILPPLVDSNDIKWNVLKSVLPSFDGIRVIYAGTPAKKDLLVNMLDAVCSCLKHDVKLQFVVVGVALSDILHYRNYNEVVIFPKNIIFLGRVSQTEVPSYFNVSDFSIIVRELSRKSSAGFPTKLAETMMAGCPVLVNYTSDISSYVHNGYNGFILPDSSAIELEKLLYDIVKLSRKDIDFLKECALECGLNKFNYSNYFEATEVFLKSLKYN